MIIGSILRGWARWMWHRLHGGEPDWKMITEPPNPKFRCRACGHEEIEYD